MVAKVLNVFVLTTLLIMIAPEVTSFVVSFEKVSMLKLPYTYSPTVEYELDKDAAEQMVFDHANKLLYSVGHTNIHVIDLTDITRMKILYNVSYTDVDVTDVEVCGSFLFVAMDNQTERENGFVNVYSVYDRESNSLELVHQITVGAVPDMIHPTADCSRLIVAIEAEPYDTPAGLVDPPGGIGIIKFTNSPAGNYTLKVLNFESFNARYPELEKEGTRFVYRGNNNVFSNDVEPEYIAFNHNETKAYLTLQENNAIAVLNLQTETIEGIHGLGFKDWSSYTMDPNDDGSINMNEWPVYGMYQPDALKVYSHKGVDYILTANEGDSKDYKGFSEETRVKDIQLSENFVSNTTQRNILASGLGRLKVSTVNGKNSTTGKYDKLYAFGGRGFSIWRASTMEQVYDSGSDIGHRTALLKPYLFNNDPGTDAWIAKSMDARSDDKGPETESLATAQFGMYTLVMVGNERPGSIAVYSIDSRLETIQPRFETLITDVPNSNESWDTLYREDKLSVLDPEDLRYVPADQSPSGDPLLLVSGSYSGTITVYKIKVNDDAFNVNSSTSVICNTGFVLIAMTVFIIRKVL